HPCPCRKLCCCGAARLDVMPAAVLINTMARPARIVVPGYPHHVVHPGNLRAQVLFSDDDRRFYLEMLVQWTALLQQELTAQETAWIRQNIATGRPTASREFVKQLEQEIGRPLTPQPRGRKPAFAANVIDLTEDMFG